MLDVSEVMVMINHLIRKALVISIILVLIVSCSPGLTYPNSLNDETRQAIIGITQTSMPDLGVAPELETTTWVNSDNILRLKDLSGKVVLLNMWTFGCVNCRNVLPHLIEWHNTYEDDGLVVIGNHFPEFEYEKDLNNLKDAIINLGIEYAVTQDNEGSTWRAYKNIYWPTIYLIDKNGHLRYSHIGEGSYSETETAIQELLNE